MRRTLGKAWVDDSHLPCRRREDLIKPACKQRVKHVMELAAGDMRFDVPLDNACLEERTTLCADAQPGHGRIVRCLQTKCATL